MPDEPAITPRKAWKPRYLVRNWPDYDRALARRGDVTVWISEAAIKAWRAAGRRSYSDLTIESALTIRKVFSLGLRQTEGFVRSILTMMGLDLPVPDHTTLSRRGRHLDLDRCVDVGREGVDIVVDSTGLRLFRSTKSRNLRCKTVKRRCWRKLHIAVNPDSSNILASDLTIRRLHDCLALPSLLGQFKGRIDRFFGDGAYDGAPTYALLAKRRQGLPTPLGIVPPRSPAVRAVASLDPLSQRGKHCAFVAKHGRRKWQKTFNYGRRNLVEAAFSRYKRIMGDGLRGRSLPAQQVEAKIAIRALNRMADLGMPITERVI